MECGRLERLKAGMIPVILARAGTEYYELQGEYLLTQCLVGGGGYLYPMDDPGDATRSGAPKLAGIMDIVADRLRHMGHKPYVLPGSGQPVCTL